MTTPPAPPTVDPDAGEAGTLVVEGPRFAIVPEWMIDSPIPDAGFRLYSLLLRYGNSSGTRMPSRATLAHRLRRSVDAVDRALRQLVEADVVRVEHRRCDGVFLANRYHVRTTGPSGGGGRTSAATAASLTEGGRNICGYRWPQNCGGGGRRSAAQPRGSYPEHTSSSGFRHRAATAAIPGVRAEPGGGGGPSAAEGLRHRRPGPALRRLRGRASRSWAAPPPGGVPAA